MKVFLCAGGSVLGNNCRCLHGPSALRYSFQSSQIKAAPHLEFSKRFLLLVSEAGGHE